MTFYFNVTLAELGGASATVFLPHKVSGVAAGTTTPPLSPYYESTRFEWGSMIGSLRPRHREDKNGGAGRRRGNATSSSLRQLQHILYGTDLWRIPHDPHWPESGVGFASEFGFGDDGSSCLPGVQKATCGWIEDDPFDDVGGKISNGVLGYDDAGAGEPFLKIGVGKLIKGSCEGCDPSDLGPGGYKFNSPYQFAEEPAWTISDLSASSISMENEAIISDSSFVDPKYGYRLKKTITVSEGGPGFARGASRLVIETSLTNLGSVPFATPWYSHHFFTCDGAPVGAVGAEYEVDLDVLPPTTSDEEQASTYEESGVGIWSTPLAEYATVVASLSTGSIKVTMDKEIEEGIKIKAEFFDDRKTEGTFQLRGCGTTLLESVQQGSNDGEPLKMYAFNMYAERGTLSPEPLYLVHSRPGETVRWAQVVMFGETNSLGVNKMRFDTKKMMEANISFARLEGWSHHTWITLSLVVGLLLTTLLSRKLPPNGRTSRPNEGYDPIE